jgi:diphthamide synthase (EF-2-diphthine--ammonia ligase)
MRAIEATRDIDALVVIPGQIRIHHMIIFHEIRTMKLQFSDIAEIRIHARRIRFTERAVPTVLRIFQDIDVMTIFAVDQMISGAMFACNMVHRTVWLCKAKGFRLLYRVWHNRE